MVHLFLPLKCQEMCVVHKNSFSCQKVFSPLILSEMKSAVIDGMLLILVLPHGLHSNWVYCHAVY